MIKKEDTYLSLFLTFLRFGVLAWGGPVAQIGMIREELVEHRQWITADKFTRALAVYQALPGPEAHELCVYMGMHRKGWIGGLLAGMAFMMPGLILILLMAWAYTLYGAKTLLPLFAGVSPAVTALIIRAVHKISQHSLSAPSLWVAAGVSVILTILHVHFIFVFIICATWQALWAKSLYKPAIAVLILLCTVFITLSFAIPQGTVQAIQGGGLLAKGLQAGLLSFGGAYTAIPFLKNSMVEVYPAVTPQAFLDSIAFTNIIPSPLVMFGTFLGYLADEWQGAALITLGIFIPAFSFTLLGHRYIEKAIENPSWHGALDGVAAGVVGLLALTALDIAMQTLTNLHTVIIFSCALAGLYFLRGKWCVPVIIISCGLMGFFLRF